MRLALALLVPLFATVSACSAADKALASVNDDSHDGSTVTLTSTGTYAGQPIVIDNSTYNGQLEITGDDSATAVTIVITPTAFTKSGDGTAAADATATLMDITSSLKLDESGGKISFTCTAPTATHGDADPSISGCSDVKVTVPSGMSGALSLNAHANYGVTATHLVFAASSPFVFNSGGGATLMDVQGSVQGKGAVGKIEASLTPTMGSAISLDNDNGDVHLSLPAGFAADSIQLSAQNGVTANGFDGLSASSTSFGAMGTGAASFSVIAPLGAITIDTQ